jgi:hypothetical protein
MMAKDEMISMVDEYTKQTTIKLPEKKHLALKLIAETKFNKSPIQSAVEEAIDQWIEKNKGELTKRGITIEGI